MRDTRSTSVALHAGGGLLPDRAFPFQLRSRRASHRDTTIAWAPRGSDSLFIWVFAYRPHTQMNRLLPARSRFLALHLARGRGSSPFRCAPTRRPPSSTNTSQMFMARPDTERVAGASGQRRAEGDREIGGRGDRGWAGAGECLASA